MLYVICIDTEVYLPCLNIRLQMLKSKKMYHQSDKNSSYGQQYKLLYINWSYNNKIIGIR